MDNKRERVDYLAVQENVELYEVRAAVIGYLIVKRRIAAGARLERIEEIVDYLVERQLIEDVHAVGGDIGHVLEHAAALLAQVHYRADIFGRRIDVRICERLFAVVYIDRVGIVGRVIYLYNAAVGQVYLIYNARHGCYEVEVIFALKALLYYLKMEQTEEAAAEAEAERAGGLRLI